MTEEFNESMINDIKEVTKSLVKFNKLKINKLLCTLMEVSLTVSSQLANFLLTHRSPSEVVKVGDEVEAYVTKIEFDEENDSGAYILSKRQLETEKSYEYLQEKLDNDEVIEAEVTEVVKGGLVVDVGQRGFVPASLISTDFIEDFSVFDGQTIALKWKN